MTTHLSRPDRSRRKGEPRAFTLIEMIVSIAILALIIGILVVGLSRARKSAGAAAGAMSVASLRSAVVDFKSHFGFPPPMIKDWNPYKTGDGVYEKDPVTGDQRLSVYQITVATDRDVLRRDPPPDPAPAAWSDGTTVPECKDYYDIRYSNVSLAAYLAGACEEKGRPTWQVPVDGHAGPGILEPRRDGTFNVPDDLKAPATSKTSRSTGKVYDAMVTAGSGGLQINASGDIREFRDSQGRKYRYYTWVQGDKQGRKLTFKDLNVPRIILETLSRPEDRFKPLNTSNAADHRASIPELNAATWAILYPGPDGVFGDEMIADLRAKLGVSDAVPELTVRQNAIADNVAEVGE